MKWIVIEENPKPDNYIAVIATEPDRKLKIEKKPCSVFQSLERAMSRARELREQYKVRNIRLFQQEGTSAFV
jgi:hypothetical protein